MRQFKPGQLQTGSIYPITASHALTASFLSGSVSFNTGSLVTTASFNAFTASYTTGSFTGSFTGDGSQLTGIVSSKWTGSNPISRQSDVEITGSLRVQGSITGSLFGTASWAENAITASYVSSNFQYEIHVSQVDGNDTTGNGDLLKPVATIGKALLLVSASVASTDRRTIIVHPGTYIENITINTTNTYFFSTGVLGANCLISGSVTISAATRMSGIKMTNLIVSSSNPIYINNCAVDKQMTVSGSGYLEVQNTSLQCTSGIQVVGPASSGVIFENCSLYPLTVNNASAAVYVISCNQAITPTLTAGALTITRSTISSLTSGATSTALTTAAGSVLVLESCNVYNSLLTSHAAVTANGFYSIKNVIYNRSASTLASLSGTGGPLATVSQFQYINADNINSTQGLTVTGSINVSGSVINNLTASYAISASQALSSSFATTASYVLPLNQNVIITGSVYLATPGVASVYFSGSAAASRLVWNDTDGTLDLGLKGGNVTLQLGQEQVVRVVNKTGANLLESQYKVARIRRVDEGGAQGQRLAIVLAQANNDANSVDTLGIVTENINDNEEGFITNSGLVRGINTTGTLQGETWTDGDVLYLSPTTPGALTTTKPQAPDHTVIMGYVVYAHSNNGKIFVKVDNGYEIDELHNVRITTGSLTAGQLLVRSGSNATGVWVNTNQLTGSYGLTGSLTATSFTGSLFGTASWASNAVTAQTASYVLNAISSSFSQTASFVTTAQTASYVLQSVSASFSVSSSRAVSASLATSASFALTSSAANVGDASDVNAQFHIAFVANNGSTQVIAADRDGLYNPKFNTLTVTASFATSASYVAAGGSNGMVQFNDSGSFSGIAGVTINKNTRSLQNGSNAIAAGQYSHAQGTNTTANGTYSHAEGGQTSAYGQFSHAEGYGTNTIGLYSHAEGESSKTGQNAYSCSINSGVVEIDAGQGDLTGTYPDGTTIWFGDVSSVGGQTNRGIVTGSSFNGTNTVFQILNDTATTIASAGILSDSGNLSNQLGGYSAHAEGTAMAFGDYSHAEGTSVTYGDYSHAEGSSTTYGNYSHAEGSSTTYGNYSHAEGASVAIGNYSHAEGGGISGIAAYQTTIIASGSITFPSYYGDISATFTPGTFIYINDINQSTVLIHEVASSLLSGSGETRVTLVDTAYNPNDGWYVGVQGNSQPIFADVTIGDSSHAEGASTITLGDGSHAAGYRTIAHGYYQSVIGQYNAPVPQSSSFVIGDGVDNATRHNLLVAGNGVVTISGSLTVSGSSTFRNIGLAVFTGSVVAQAVTGSFTGSFVGDGSGLTGVGATEYIRRSDYTGSLDPNVNYLYTGYAPAGSAEASIVWTLSRLAISSSGATITQVTSSAAWTNRYSYTYL